MLDFDVDAKACADLRTFFRFLFKAGFLVGGRITVMVDPPRSDPEGSINNEGERIVACALWLPPRTRLAIWMVPTIVKAGIIPVVKCWGLKGLLVRIPIFNTYHTLTTLLRESFSNTNQRRNQACTVCLRRKGLKCRPMIHGTSNKFLPIQSTRERVSIFYDIFTSSVKQLKSFTFYVLWKGMMSKLVREAFAYSPEFTFTLEATTPKSRDQYACLGFEVMIP